MTRLRLDLNIADQRLLARNRERASANREALQERKTTAVAAQAQQSAAATATPAEPERRGGNVRLDNERRPAAVRRGVPPCLLYLQWKEQSLPSIIGTSPLRYQNQGRNLTPSYELRIAAATSPYSLINYLYLPYQIGNTGVYEYGRANQIGSVYGMQLSQSYKDAYAALNPLSYVRKEFVLSLGYQGISRTGTLSAIPTLLPDINWTITQRYFDQTFRTLSSTPGQERYVIGSVKEEYIMTGYRLVAIKCYKAQNRNRIQFAFDQITSTQTFYKGLNNTNTANITQSLGSSYSSTANALIHTLELGRNGPSPVEDTYQSDAPNLLSSLTSTRRLNDVFVGSNKNNGNTFDVFDLGVGNPNGGFDFPPNYGWMERWAGLGVYDDYPALRFLGDSNIWNNNELQSLRRPNNNSYAITTSSGAFTVASIPELQDRFTAQDFAPYDITQRTYNEQGAVSFLQSCIFLNP